MELSFNSISTIAALSKIIEIRQFGLDEDYGYLAKQPDVQKLNEHVIKATGVNILNEHKPLHIDDIERCETFLDKLMDNVMSKKYGESYLNDEIAVLEQTQDVALNDFRSLNIGLASISPEVKKIFKALGIIAPAIPRIIRDAYHVQKMGGEDPHFFAVSRVEIKSRIVLVLFHMNIAAVAISDFGVKTEKVAGNRLAFNMPKDVSTFHSTDENKLPRVNICFLFKEANIHLSPVRMFLRSLSKYGKNLTINHNTQKLFLEVVSSSLSIMQGNRLVFEGNSLVHNIEDFVLYYGIHINNKRTTYTFIYGFNEGELVSDAARFVLL